MVYAAQPREGTETHCTVFHHPVYVQHGLCSSTPRGDGNAPSYGAVNAIRLEVYAAQPREGTETTRGSLSLSVPTTWFMQLNPARGRKHEARHAQGFAHSRHGLCSSTPRGDGNLRSTKASQAQSSLGLCSSTPRGDGNYERVVYRSRLHRLQGLCSSTPRGDGNQFPL